MKLCCQNYMLPSEHEYITMQWFHSTYKVDCKLLFFVDDLDINGVENSYNFCNKDIGFRVQRREEFSLLRKVLFFHKLNEGYKITTSWAKAVIEIVQEHKLFSIVEVVKNQWWSGIYSLYPEICWWK